MKSFSHSFLQNLILEISIQLLNLKLPSQFKADWGGVQAEGEQPDWWWSCLSPIPFYV